MTKAAEHFLQAQKKRATAGEAAKKAVRIAMAMAMAEAVEPVAAAAAAVVMVVVVMVVVVAMAEVAPGSNSAQLLKETGTLYTRLALVPIDRSLRMT
jgi:hypothetical protein